MSEKLVSNEHSYNTNTDGLIYLRTYYNELEACKDEINQWHITNMADILRDNKIQGENILEIGSGPSLLCSLLVAPYFQSVYPGDYNPEFQKPLRDWYFHNANENFDFTNIVDCISKSHNLKNTTLTNLARKRFKGTIKLDVHTKDILTNNEVKTFDGMITRFCIDSCSPSLESYNEAIKNIGSLLKKDGIFLQMGFFEDGNETYQKGFWELGNKTYIDLRLTKKEIYDSLTEAGLKVVDWRELKATNVKGVDYHNSPIYALYAIKV